MIVLNEEQIDIIRLEIMKGGIVNETLISELLDHYACCIEDVMQQGYSFEEAYKNAYQQITPNGTKEIEEELFFVLTFNQHITMKKVLYSGGFIAASSFNFGFLFRILHWPGAEELFLISAASFILLVAPVWIYLTLKNKVLLSVGDHFRMWVGIVSTFLLSSGFIFKIMHMPGADLQILCGMVLLSLVFFPLFFLRLYRRSIA
jgi:hypothetical protein